MGYSQPLPPPISKRPAPSCCLIRLHFNLILERRGQTPGSSPWRALTDGVILIVPQRSFQGKLQLSRLTIVQGQGPQYHPKMSLDIFGRTGTLTVVKQKPESPCVRNGKPLVKEDGSVWLLRTIVRAPLNFKLSPDSQLLHTYHGIFTINMSP